MLGQNREQRKEGRGEEGAAKEGCLGSKIEIGEWKWAGVCGGWGKSGKNVSGKRIRSGPVCGMLCAGCLESIVTILWNPAQALQNWENALENAETLGRVCASFGGAWGWGGVLYEFSESLPQG
jgi:hypothetical protein